MSTKTIVRCVAAAMEGGSTRALTIVSTILTDTRAGAMRPVRVMTPSSTTDATRAIAAARAKSSRIARIWIRAPIAGKAIAGRGFEARQLKRRGRDPSLQARPIDPLEGGPRLTHKPVKPHPLVEQRRQLRRIAYSRGDPLLQIGSLRLIQPGADKLFKRLAVH